MKIIKILSCIAFTVLLLWGITFLISHEVSSTRTYYPPKSDTILDSTRASDVIKYDGDTCKGCSVVNYYHIVQSGSWLQIKKDSTP